MTHFTDTDPRIENYWRSIILFGRNVASYKFALAKALLETGKGAGEVVALDELAGPFSKNICEHLKLSDKQATSQSSRFLDACRSYNTGQISRDALIEQTVRLGFQNVIDAFHVVNQREIPVRFFTDDRKSDGGICLTDNLFSLFESVSREDLPLEIEARWRLVETAWTLNISRNLVTVGYDNETGLLFAGKANRRADISSSRDALNGYQKGKCFYCSGDINIAPSGGEVADVDHFFPHVLKGTGVAHPVDGVWNLVLACRECNRGEKGKFARLPTIGLLERLEQRNNYLISSHHPLRETLMKQTGNNDTLRHEFLQTSYTNAKELLIHTWSP